MWCLVCKTLKVVYSPDSSLSLILKCLILFLIFNSITDKLKLFYYVSIS